MFLCFGAVVLERQLELGPDGGLPGPAAAGSELHLVDLLHPQLGQWHRRWPYGLGLGGGTGRGDLAPFGCRGGVVDSLSALESGGHPGDLADAANQPLNPENFPTLQLNMFS